MIKIIISSILLLTMSIEVDAQQNRRLERNIRKNMLEAYDYRSDIDKKVLSKTRKWTDGYGILHHDWIENPNGKSVDLYGEEILPQYDYTQLDRWCDSLYVMKVGTRRGVVTATGRQVIPFAYWNMNFKRIDQGLIFAQQNAAGTGKVDIYTTEGQKVCEKSNVRSIDAYYDATYNYVEVYCTYYNEQAEVCYRYYPDGEEITDSLPAEGATHPAIPVSSRQVLWKMDELSFKYNTWVKLFRQYYEQKKYDDAFYCISFFFTQDLPSLLSASSIPNVITYTSILDCYYKLGLHEDLVKSVEGRLTDLRLPRGFYFNVISRQVESGLELMYTEQDQAYLQDMVDDINELYVNSLSGYRQSVMNRQANAQRWMAVMNASAQVITQTVVDIAKEEDRRRAASSNRNRRPTPAASSSTSHASASSTSSQEEEEEREESGGMGSGTRKSIERIDKHIARMEESLRKAEISEAKEHDTATFLYIQSLKNNIKELQQTKNDLMRGK